MNKNLSRITIEVPSTIHKKLKARAVEVEKSIKEIIMGFLEDYLSTENSKKQ